MTQSSLLNRPLDLGNLEELLQPSPISRSELGVFTRQLASMVRSGIPVGDAILLIASISEKRRFRRVLQDIGQSIQRGRSIAESFAAYPKIFDTIYCSLIAAGEEAGQMEELLGRLAETIEKLEKLKKQIVGASIYPVTVLVLSTVIALAMCIFIVPVFVNLFESTKTPLPLPTQILVIVSNGLRNPMIVGPLLVLIVGLVVGFTVAMRNRRFRLAIDHLVLRIPVLGTFIRKNLTAAVIRVMGTMLESGITLTDTLRITQATVNNLVYRQALMRARADVAVGKSLSRSLESTPEIPKLFVRLLAVGEETGDMFGSIRQAAEIYESEVELGLKALTALLEPLMIVIVATVVGGILVALYMPVFNLGNAFIKR